MREWLRQRATSTKSGLVELVLAPQMISDEFFEAAADIRKNLELDLIVGLTPARVAGTDPDNSLFYDHFSATLEKEVLVSTADLRKFSAAAGRPFEAGVGALVVSALLVAINNDLDYHDDTGCIFDYNEDRASIVPALKSLTVDSQCLGKMSQVQVDATKSMLRVLRRMKRGDSNG
jgi:hypothetical protein